MNSIFTPMQILFFAQLKDATGYTAIELPATAPLRGDQLWSVLLERFPALAVHRTSVRLACNQEYAGPKTLYCPGDEVALIPPVSGG